MMQKLLSLACLLAVVTLGAAILTWARANAACDNKGASASTMPCYTAPPGEMLCAGATSQKACGNQYIQWIHVEEGFPRECVTLADNNCNEPNAKCYVGVHCEWKDNRCQEVPDSYGGLWQQKPKKQSDPCPPQG